MDVELGLERTGAPAGREQLGSLAGGQSGMRSWRRQL